MRRVNSEFQTQYLSEEGQKLSNRDYFGYVELDDFACYVMADSLDDDMEANSARIVVESLIRSFVERPTMRKRPLERYIRQAHRELKKERKGRRLKASVIVVVTDYKSLRYCQVGNSRFYLIRNGRYLLQTRDQSLTQNLIEAEKLPMDQAMMHQERNNLYSYLGMREKLQVEISSKVKLEDGDILAQSTRGVWENCSDEELLEAANAATEAKEILDQVEDLVLGQQEEKEEIDNYSLAVTFVTKVFVSPKKKVSVKQVIMIAIPILLVVGILSVTLYIRYRNQKAKEVSLIQYMESGEEYLRYDNYKKASEEYTEAKRLAGDLKHQEDLKEADQYLKLTEQIILADEAMLAGEHVKAQDLYLAAKELSVRAGNVGKKYIESQLEQTRNYLEVYDWISVGEIKEEYGDLEGAITAYKQAKEKASALYDKEGKEEALKKQVAAEEKLTAQQEAAVAAEEAEKKESQAEEEKEKESQAAELELENQQRVNEQKNAIELENTANDLMKEGNFAHAITFYRTAQSIYYRLELLESGDAVEEKIQAAEAGMEAAEELKAAESEAERQAEAEAKKLAEESQAAQKNGPGE